MTTPAPRPRIALCGNPNTGKTSLFNVLTGSNARVGNYPGVTVERELADWQLPAITAEVLDVPGTYSLAARSREEQVAIRALFGLDGDQRPHLAVVVLDATQLVRNLYFAVQIIEAGIPVVLAVNLIDIARAQGLVVDIERLRSVLGVPAVAVSARTGEGLKQLANEVEAVLHLPARGQGSAPWTYPAALEADLATLVPRVQSSSAAEARALSLWALLSLDVHDELMDVPPHVREAVITLRAQADAAHRDIDVEIIGSRYRWLDAQQFVRAPALTGPTLTERVDRILLHPILGILAFVLVMGVLFQSLFSWSDPAIGAIEALFAWSGDMVRATFPASLLTDLVVDGLIGGVGSVVVFLPQILLLFFLLGILEDSGYMARVAYLVDRGMKSLGLHGRAFVPMLSGYACAVPAIMATRTLESQRDRLLTMMVVPLMSCSARLPVYTLIIAALFPTGHWLGFIPVQGGMMVAMYLFSTGTALLAAGVLGRTVFKGKRQPLLLELPPYRLPKLSTVLRQMWLRARSFLTEAGTVILACTVVLWGLLTFPQDVPLSRDYEALRATAPEEQVSQLDSEEAAERLQGSYAGQLGKALEPVIAPLGFDWKIGIGLVGAFAAREVFVATMGLVYGIGDEADETSAPLRDRIRAEVHADGRAVYTPLTGLSLMVFFAISAQCLSTLATVKRESGSWRWTGFLFLYMTTLAWIMSFLVYQGGRLLGF